MTADTPTDAEMIAAVRRLVSQMEGRALYLEAEHQAASIHVYKDDFDAMRKVLAHLEGLAAAHRMRLPTDAEMIAAVGRHLDFLERRTCRSIAEMEDDAAAFHAILARLEGLAAPGEGWQPIETAPKDNRFVLLHVPHGLESGVVTIGAYWKAEERAENGRFKAGNWDGWLGMDADILSSWCEPTHWMPLPKPPVTPCWNGLGSGQ